MKALTIWEPWATLVALGVKRIETRGWSTHYRGPLLIHAAKFWPVRHEKTAEEFVRQLHRAAGVSIEAFAPMLAGATLGRVLALVDLIDCQPMDVGPTRVERPLGDYGRGRFGFALANVRRLAQPSPVVRGYQSFWDPTPELRELVDAFLALGSKGGAP